MKFQLPVETVNATLEYLATKPYREVAHLISMLHSGQSVEEPKPESKEEPAHAADAQHHES